MSNTHNASIIALAWPKTNVRRIGVWYDQVTQWLGFITRDYYRAGHAAAVLVDHYSGSLTYFDFGRYHTPEKMGRLRSVNTDPELKLHSRAVFQDNGDIGNIEEILIEIGAHPSTHGDGVMYASVANGINLERAWDFTRQLQGEGMVHYGPFDLRGTNCSRFVRDIIRTSTNSFWTKFRLSLPWMITPATKWNVIKANEYGAYYKINGRVIIHRDSPLSQGLELPMIEDSILPEPVLILDNSQNTCTDGNC